MDGTNRGPYEYPLTICDPSRVATACAPNPTWHRAGVTILPGGTAIHPITEVRLSEADVDRIANRVVELLKERAS